MKMTEEQKEMLKVEYEQLTKVYESIKEEKSKIRRNREEKDKVCPHCGEKNDIIQNIKRIQGKIDGEGSGSSILGCGSWSASLHGKLDTNEIWHCNKCSNEWKISEIKYDDSEKAMDGLFWYFYYYYSQLKDIDNITFDENDLTEKHTSLKEKVQAEKDRINTAYFKPDSEIRKYHVETVIQFLQHHSYSMDSSLKRVLDYPKECFIEWGCKTFPVKLSFWGKVKYFFREN